MSLPVIFNLSQTGYADLAKVQDLPADVHDTVVRLSKGQVGPTPTSYGLVGEIQLATSKGRKGQVRIPAARVGVFDHPSHGKVTLTKQLFRSFIRNWKNRVLGFDLAVDSAHQPALGALAWVKDVQIEGDKLVLYAKPTPEGKGKLGAGFKYASIEYTLNFIDRETGKSFGPALLGCAATNRPFVHKQDEIRVLSWDMRNRQRRRRKPRVTPEMAERLAREKRLQFEGIADEDQADGLIMLGSSDYR